VSLRETYGLPRRTPAAIRVVIFMLVAAAVWVLLWLVLPDGPVTVVVLVVVVLASLFAGLARIMQSREFSELPERHPVPPPSTEQLEQPPDRR
jgi:hypothetical protein